MNLDDSPVSVPAFVWRGLATMNNGNPESIRYANEGELRDAMATLWWARGADVRTEVKVPECGRIDVLASIGRQHFIIELKTKIEMPSEALRAFQQAHTYAAYMEVYANKHAQPEAQSDLYRSVVTAGRISPEAVRSAEDAFWLTVDLYDFFNVATLANPCRYPDLLIMARRRQAAVANLTSLMMHSDRELSTDIEFSALLNRGTA